MDGGDHPDFSTPKIGQFSSGKKEKGEEKNYAMDTALFQCPTYSFFRRANPTVKPSEQFS